MLTGDVHDFGSPEANGSNNAGRVAVAWSPGSSFREIPKDDNAHGPKRRCLSDRPSQPDGGARTTKPNAQRLRSVNHVLPFEKEPHGEALHLTEAVPQDHGTGSCRVVRPRLRSVLHPLSPLASGSGAPGPASHLGTVATAELPSPPPTLDETTVYSAARNPPTVLGNVILKQQVSPGSPKIPPSSTDKPHRNDTEEFLTPGNLDKGGKSGRWRTITESQRRVKAVSPSSPSAPSDTLDVTPAVNYPNRTFCPGMVVVLSDDSGTDLCDAVVAGSNVRPATVCRVIKGQSLITKTGPFASKEFMAVKVTNIKVKKNTKYPYRRLKIKGTSPRLWQGRTDEIYICMECCKHLVS